MREAVVEAKVAVRELGEGVVRTEAELAAERQRLADAERRGRLAAEIQDRETGEVAARFAAKHRERLGGPERKLAAPRDELGLPQRGPTEVQAPLARAGRGRPAAPAAGPTSSWRVGPSRSSPRAPRRASSRTWAPRTKPSRSRRCAKRCASCLPRSTNSPRCCAARYWPSITSTWRSGSSGWARFCARRARPSRYSRTSSSTDGVTTVPSETAGWFGHPRGLSTLFFTEMGERVSYYRMRAFLILCMTAPVAAGGLGFDVPRASSVYGTDTGSVWVTPI